MGAKAKKGMIKKLKKKNTSSQLTASTRKAEAAADFLPLEGGPARKIQVSEKQMENKATVLYIGRIPHGFYENEMEGFFKQFGTIKRLRIARNKKTGKSKHFGFIEFESSEVAKIVADTMHNYLLFEHLLQVCLIPPERVHPKLPLLKVKKKWQNCRRRRRRGTSTRSDDRHSSIAAKPPLHRRHNPLHLRHNPLHLRLPATRPQRHSITTHVRELEEEVKLLKNLSHPNIVRYLGTAREEESLNILLEFVPGGSISSLLGKFGSFPESVLRMYTKQLLQGLEYLHKNGIMHRDIKGANILVDNKGCIKLADFGASKKVVELATMTGAKSMKGTPYWMAPEVILQTGHSFSADVWSVGCTVIEMATGKPPWSQQYQEVAALFHIGTTKSHPPIPDHLSAQAKDFLLKCLHKEPDFRPSASDLLQHPFVTGEYQEAHPVYRTSVIQDNSGKHMETSSSDLTNSSMNPVIRPTGTGTGLKEVNNKGNVRCSTIYPEKFSGRGSIWGSSNYDDDMCQIEDEDDLVVGASVKYSSALLSADFNKSFNPMSEPNYDWQCKFDDSPELEKSAMSIFSSETTNKHSESPGASGNGDNDLTFPSGPVAAEDDDEVTESKIRAFLDEKALDLKRLQSPLYEEFYNSLNAPSPPGAVGTEDKENISHKLNLPPKSRSPNRAPSRRLSAAVDVAYAASPGSRSKRVSDVGNLINQTLQEVKSPPHGELKEVLDSSREPFSPSASFSERQRKWKEELDEELERKREMLRQAGVAKTSSPRILNRQRDRFGNVASGKSREVYLQGFKF